MPFVFFGMCDTRASSYEQVLLVLEHVLYWLHTSAWKAKQYVNFYLRSTC